MLVFFRAGNHREAQHEARANQSNDSLLQKGDAALQSGYGPCRAHRPQPGCFVESTYLRYIP